MGKCPRDIAKGKKQLHIVAQHLTICVKHIYRSANQFLFVHIHVYHCLNNIQKGPQSYNDGDWASNQRESEPFLSSFNLGREAMFMHLCSLH